MTNIYVGNLPFTASEDEVRALFEQHGTVSRVHLVNDRETGRPRGFGFIEMDDDTEGRVPLAVVGVVPVNASAENGPIQPGDMLVASSTPGHVMRAGPNPAVGTVIGKALEPLDEGTGVIQMLVMLQ